MGRDKEVGLDMDCWNHHLLNRLFMSGWTDKVTRDLEAGRGDLTLSFASVKQASHFA